jgi:hypothetical protein
MTWNIVIFSSSICIGLALEAFGSREVMMNELVSHCKGALKTMKMELRSAKISANYARNKLESICSGHHGHHDASLSGSRKLRFSQKSGRQASAQ